MRISNPEGSWDGWITPGGGLDGGEVEIQGLRRELYEELGFTSATVPLRIWTRDHRFPWKNKLLEIHDVFYYVPTPRFHPCPTIPLEDSEMMGCLELRWWPIEKILASSEIFAPPNLGQLLQRLVEEGPPEVAMDIGS